MAENLVTPEKSLNDDEYLSDEYLAQMSYKQLQALAMSLKLPANVKQSSMLALIKAQRSEDTEEVQRIMSENKQLRNRSRAASRTSSTSPKAESLTFPLSISPPECLLQTVPVPIATSSPKIIRRNASQQTKEDLLEVKSEMAQTDDVTGLMSSHDDLKCKESMVDSVGNDSVSASCNISSDRSPDPLEMESSLTGTDSAENSIGSDLDPVTSAKDNMAFSEREAIVKDFAELKPVPPSELMDLSLPVPLLDCSLALRQALGPISPQHSLLHPISTSFTKALMPHSAVEDHMISDPLSGLCTPDSTMNGTASISSTSAPAMDYTQPKVPSDYTQPNVSSDRTQPKVPSDYTQPNVPSDRTQLKLPSDAATPPSSTSEEASFGRQHLDSLKRPVFEPVPDIALSPSKVQKIVINTQSLETVGPKVSLNPPALMPTAPPPELFSKLPKSITIVTLPTVTTTSTAVTFTVTSVAPVPVPAIISSSDGGTILSTTNSATISSNISHQSLSGDARVSNTYTSTVCTPPVFSITRKTTRSSSRSTKSLTAGLWPMQTKSNIQIGEPDVKGLLEPKKVLAKSSGTAPKSLAGIKPPSKKLNMVKLPTTEITAVYSEMGQIQFRPKVSSAKQVLPTRPATNQICCGSTHSPRSRQTHNFRSTSLPAISSTTTTFVSAPIPTTVTSSAKRFDQPSLSAPSVLTQTVPRRNQANAVARPARPETVLNFAPTSNLPAFSHLADLYENPKPPKEFPFVDTFDDTLVQPRVETAPPVLSQSALSKPSPLDVPTAYVGQNLSARPNFSYDTSVSTLRHLLESPSSNGLQTRRLYNTYQFDNEQSSVFAKPQSAEACKDLGIDQIANSSLQIQSSKQECRTRPKTQEYVAQQRSGASDLPKSLESIYNYRGEDAESVFCTSSSKLAAAHRSDNNASLFVASGVGGPGPTHTVACYEAVVCSVRAKPARSHVGVGYPAGERYRAPQEFAPYSSNYPVEQSAEMYGASINAALSQQPCQAPWFASDPSLPALPINPCWFQPQPVNPQPPLRLTQPFRHFNQRNVPNYFLSPLKSLHTPNQSAFMNQPQIDPLYLPPQDTQSYQPRNVQAYPHRDVQSYQHRDTPLYQPRDQAYQHRDVQSYQPRDMQAHHLREMQAYQPSETFDRTLPVQDSSQPASQELVAPTNQAPSQVAQDVPDFQGRSDQLSLSMIYNYLTSTEQMPPSSPRPEYLDNQSPPNQRPVYSRPIFPGTAPGTSAGTATPQPTATSATPAPRSKRTAPAKDSSRRQQAQPMAPPPPEPENTTLTREAAFASVSALRKRSKNERQKCVNFENGCPLILPLSQLGPHEESCEYFNFKCPKESCEWNGRARKLASHVREAHRMEITTKTDCRHILTDIEALERVCFFQEVSRKLFAICVHCHGGVLYVSIQYIASGRSERPTSACGCIEVLGQDGHPYSWRGKLQPYYQSVESLLSTASCLEVSLTTLGAQAAPTLTLHVSIRVYSGNANVSAQLNN